MASAHPYDVIIAGGGIVGASVAWHAAQIGLKVAVIDASGPAAGASGASDGAVSVASKKPGLMADLAGKSLTYCRELAAPGQVLAGSFHARPSFCFASGGVETQALDRLAQMLAFQDLPVTVTRDSSAKDSSVAGWGPSVERVIEMDGEGHMLGFEATRAFLQASDADLIWPCRLKQVDTTHGRISLDTDRGELIAGKLVVATGMGSAALFPELPMIPRSGQLVVTDRTAGAGWPGLAGPLTSASYLLDKSERSARPGHAPVVIDPLRSGQILIGSSREDHGTEAQTDFRTLRRILASGTRVLPALASRRVIRVFAGVRAATVDGLPIVGPFAGAENIIIATGFEGDGICLSPLIGREVANMAAGRPVSSALAALSPNRFHDKREAAQ